MMLKDLGKTSEALEYFKKYLIALKETLGKKHPDVAISYKNIGTTLRDLGKPDEGLEYLKKSSAILKEVLGEQHSDLVKIYNNIGNCLKDLGKPVEVFKKSFRNSAESFGKQQTISRRI